MRATNLNILAFDTVTEACSVALLLRGAVDQRLETGARHSRRVLSMAEEVMRAAGAELRDLHALAVDVGPGAFTGARLGIGVAQGLAYGAGLPVAAVNSLEALAEDVLRPGDSLPRHPRSPLSGGGDGDGDSLPRHPRNPPPRHFRSPPPRHPRSPLSGGGDDAGALVLPAIDARMGQVYFGLYGAAGVIIEPALATPGDVGGALAGAFVGNIIGAGSGWDHCAPALQESLSAAMESSESSGLALQWRPDRHPQAAAVARIASARGLAHAVGPLHLRAVYIRNAVAKPAGGGDGRSGDGL